MHECCGRERKSPFCPECGKALSGSQPLVSLLQHCRRMARQAQHMADKLAARAADRRASGRPEWAVKTEARVPATRRRADQWIAWAEAVAAIIEGTSPILDATPPPDA